MGEQQNHAPTPAIDIEQLARLAKIRLTDSERADLAAQLRVAFAAVTDALRPLDEIDIAPSGALNGLSNVFRQDIPTPSLAREEILAAAPAQSDGCFLVPKTLK